MATDETTHSSMWDAFEHVLLFIILYVMATAIALIINFYIDKYFPGVESSYYSYSDYPSQMSGLLRGELAALIVSYPLYSFFFLAVTKRSLANPVIKTLKSRKFLIYLTLVITFVIGLVSIISL